MKTMARPDGPGSSPTGQAASHLAGKAAAIPRAAAALSSLRDMPPEAIQAMRIRFGKAKDFAEYIGVTPEHLSRLENGAKPLSKTMRRLLQLLEDFETLPDNRKEVMPDDPEQSGATRGSGPHVTRPREKVRVSGGAKIIAGLDDAIAYAQGDKSRAMLLTVKSPSPRVYVFYEKRQMYWRKPGMGLTADLGQACAYDRKQAEERLSGFSSGMLLIPVDEARRARDEHTKREDARAAEARSAASLVGEAEAPKP